MNEQAKPAKSQKKGLKKLHRRRDLTDEELAELDKRHEEWLKGPTGAPDKAQKTPKFPKGDGR